MARIPLTSGFTVCPEGTYVFTCTSATYDEKFGKVQLSFTADNGAKHSETFSLLTDANTLNEGASNAFSFMAKTLLNDFSAEDVDIDELTGRQLRGTITHTQSESKRTPGKMLTFAHLGNLEPVDEVDVDALLG